MKDYVKGEGEADLTRNWVKICRKNRLNIIGLTKFEFENFGIKLG